MDRLLYYSILVYGRSDYGFWEIISVSLYGIIYGSLSFI